MSDGGWEDSAEAWIASLGADGDFTRRYVTDPAALGRLEGRVFRSALDVGCGEGRFCRILRELGITTTGVDPTRRLIDEALRCDPAGDYRVGRAEALDFADGSFDLVVSYLSLIDIAGLQEAFGKMLRVLEPGGTLLIVNLATSVRPAQKRDGSWPPTALASTSRSIGISRSVRSRRSGKASGS